MDVQAVTQNAQTDQQQIDVSIKNATKVFTPKGREPTQALSEVSLDVYSREFVAIVGPSGCGKSTLANLIAGLTPVSQGTVSVFGKQVDGPHSDVGYVFQKDLLLPWRSIKKNILLQAEMRGMDKARANDEADALLQMTGLTDFADRLPHELSGGMRQRIAICRALLHSPSLLLMDEPFGALDAMTRDQMNLDLARIQHEKQNTVVFITHSIDEAVFLADRVVLMAPRPGRVVDVIDIDIERPRDIGVRETPLFADYVAQIRHGFERLGVFK